MNRKTDAMALALVACLVAGFDAPAKAAIDLGWQDLDPTITVNGNTSASTVKGEYKRRNGTVVKTSDEQLKEQTEHAKEYNGPTKFTADYDIMLFDGLFEGGTVTFTTIYFTWTHDGMTEEYKSNFTTEPIPITSVNLNPDGSVASFTFYAPDWYPPGEDGYDAIINKGLTGTINLDKKTAEYQASYQLKHNAAIDTFTVAGTIATPEPATWAMLLLGFASLGFAGYRRAAGQRSAALA